MHTSVAGGEIGLETHQGITTISFSHPQRNSLPGGLLEALANEIHSAGYDEETKVIVLRSEGDATFCAGASFDELAGITSLEQGIRFFSGFARVINAMRKCPRLIIARVQGPCVGGGVGLVAAADYAIALEGAEVKLSELSIGIGPFVVGPAIERKIGHAAFSQLAIDSALWRNADWARRKGLYAELHSNIEAVDESVRRLSSHLAHASPAAMVEMKKMFWKATEHWDELLHDRASISGKLILTEQAKNAIRQFKQKKSL